MMQRLFACCHMAGVAGGLPDVPGLPDASDLELPECPVASTKENKTQWGLFANCISRESKENHFGESTLQLQFILREAWQ